MSTQDRTKRLTDAELAAEWWRQDSFFKTAWRRTETLGDKEYLVKSREREFERLCVMERFATLPHYDGAAVMSTTYNYWADQGANPEEFSCASGIDYTDPTNDECQHDNPDNDYECVDCGAAIEGWEPTDAQIFACYGQTKEVA